MNRQVLLSASKDKLAAALEILFASVDAYASFCPARRYTPKEHEPCDTLADRYLRAIESHLKFFRTLERFREAAPSRIYADIVGPAATELRRFLSHAQQSRRSAIAHWKYRSSWGKVLSWGTGECWRGAPAPTLGRNRSSSPHHSSGSTTT